MAEVEPQAGPPGEGGLPPGADKWPQWKIEDWIIQQGKVGNPRNSPLPAPIGNRANQHKDLSLTFNGEAVEAGFAPPEPP